MILLLVLFARLVTAENKLTEYSPTTANLFSPDEVFIITARFATVDPNMSYYEEDEDIHTCYLHHRGVDLYGRSVSDTMIGDYYDARKYIVSGTDVKLSSNIARNMGGHIMWKEVIATPMWEIWCHSFVTLETLVAKLPLGGKFE